MSDHSEVDIHQIVERVVSQVLGLSIKGPAVQTETPSGVPAARNEPSPQPISVSKKIVAIGADHGGYELKEILKTELATTGYQVEDIGTNSKEAVDYPDYAHAVAKLVSSSKAAFGIMIDGAGIGSCIVANKVPGIRAGMAYDISSAINSREHNNTNVLTLGAGMIGNNLAKQIVKTWLTTDFAGGRHLPRIEKISKVEEKYLKPRES